MPRCDDCNSDAIDLSANPVPFGEYYHLVAHVSEQNRLKITYYLSGKILLYHNTGCNKWTYFIWQHVHILCSNFILQ